MAKLKWSPVPAPDALDMLITARNHDLKREVARHPEPKDWIFSLVSLQTMEGFGGAGNYGIARMNGGSSSRAMFALAPATEGSAQIDPSSSWARDTRALLSRRQGIAGPALLWLYPWGDADGFDLDRLDPMVIEVCRRIRLQPLGDQIIAERSTSKAARIAGKEAKGNTGDPWAPLHKTEAKSFTLGEQDFSCDVLTRLFCGDEWKIPDLALPQPGETDQPMILIAEAFSRGNSKTDGFRSRVVPLPKAVVNEGLFGPSYKSVSEEVQKDIAATETALRNGLAMVAAGGEGEKMGKPHYARSLTARENYRRAVDHLFFEELWRRASAREDLQITEMRRAFLSLLAGIARKEFDLARSAIPCASLFRPRAEARGRGVMERGIAKALNQFQITEVQHV